MQHRTLLLLMVLGGVVLSTLWDHTIRLPGDVQEGLIASVTPPSGPVAYANPPASQDSLSERDALRQIERLYRLQADIMEAQVDRDADQVETLLHSALDELEPLSKQSGLVQRPRFRQAFRTLTAEYENRYGVPDTLRLPDGRIHQFHEDLSARLGPEKPRPLTEVLPTDLQDQNHTVPLTVNEPVRETMTFLLSHKQRHLYPWLRRASTYFPMIEQIFAEEGVPNELKYLALAESGLDPYAESRAKASGIWQFVAETARQYDLSIDPWVDERLDPEKSTRAAAQHLRDLYEQFGDWELALAGYNCNPRAVEYAIHRYRQRTGRDPTFWAIYEDLPEETRNYVPLFTATALIISNFDTFDLKQIEPGPRYAFDHVPVEAPLRIQKVAELAEVDVQEVRVLNPELRSDRLPPAEEPYYVRLPYGTYSTFAGNYNALPEEERSPDLQHVVQGGETAGHIAQRYHVRRSDLLAANGDDGPTLQVGQRLTIPETRYAGNARIAEAAEREPIRVRYGNRAVRSLTDGPEDMEFGAPLGTSTMRSR